MSEPIRNNRLLNYYINTVLGFIDGHCVNYDDVERMYYFNVPRSRYNDVPISKLRFKEGDFLLWLRSKKIEKLTRIKKVEKLIEIMKDKYPHIVWKYDKEEEIVKYQGIISNNKIRRYDFFDSLIKSGYKISDISKRFSVSKSTLYRIKNGKIDLTVRFSKK